MFDSGAWTELSMSHQRYSHSSWLMPTGDVLLMGGVREATKKKQEKNFTTVVNYLQKWRTPLPLFHNNFSHFWNLKIDVFLQLLRVSDLGELTKTR